MSESIFLRVRRLLSAKVEDAVDGLETANSQSTMRETIREVDRAIDQVQAELEECMARRLQAARQQKLLREKAASMTAKASFALQEARDDLAGAALIRQVDLEEQAASLDAVQAQSAQTEARLAGSLTALKSRKVQMEEVLAAFLTARRDAALGGDGPTQTDRHIEKRVVRAEQAFDRAMTGAGGVPFTRSNADTITRVAEISGLEKRATVAERLAALKHSVQSA